MHSELSEPSKLPELEKQFEKVILKASEEKMFPKFIWQFSKKNKTERLYHDFAKKIKNKYTQQLRHPLQYNPQQAKTHREAFRQKVLKLINNELDIEYLKSEQTGQKRIMTYNGHPLDAIKYDTKKQFKIFQNIGNNVFNSETNQIYEDKLQYQHDKVFRTDKKRINTTISVVSDNKIINCKTDFKDNIQKITKCKEKYQKIKTQPNKAKEIQVLSLPKLLPQSKVIPTLGKSLLKHSPRIQNQLIIGKMIHHNKSDERLAYERMLQIGGYNEKGSLNMANISLTKQSILKYFKQTYERAQRIVDFLQFGSVQNYQTYCRKALNLKLMPKDHIEFLCFLCYDSNNDGYICQTDVLRLQELTSKCPILQVDLNRMKKQAPKYKLQSYPGYLQLYKLPEINETTYFNFLKKTPLIDQSSSLDIEMKNYMVNHTTKKNKIYIDFYIFKKIFKKEKPVLWYDLLWKVCGLKYQGLHY